MYLELDCTSYIFRNLIYPIITSWVINFPRSLQFPTCYVINLVVGYHIAQMIGFGFCVVIFILNCIQTMLKIAPLFLTRTRNLYNLNVLIRWFKCFQIGNYIAAPMQRNAILFGVIGCNVTLTSVSYALIRLNHELQGILIAGGWVGYLLVAMVIKFGWGMISGIHSNTKYCLKILVQWGVLSRIGTIRERRLHSKILKSMRPIELPVGLGSYTFFYAKKSNELIFGMYAVDNTISLLLM